jgi:hypothetical protein
MKKSFDDQQGQPSKPRGESDQVLDKLEEMWDKQILKGDDDSDQNVDFFKSDENTKNDKELNEVNQRNKRRGKRI